MDNELKLYLAYYGDDELSIIVRRPSDAFEQFKRKFKPPYGSKVTVEGSQGDTFKFTVL